MSLQGITWLMKFPEVAERVSRSVDPLDDTIREIVSAIFGLQTHPEAKTAAVRATILFVAQEMTTALGFPHRSCLTVPSTRSFPRQSPSIC